MTFIGDEREIALAEAVFKPSIEVDRSFDVLLPFENKVEIVKHHPNKVIAGDTDSCFIDLSGKFANASNAKEVIVFADNLADKVNATFSIFMQKVFNCSKESAKVVKTAREVVSDRSYFIAKKNYIAHVVDVGGISKDEFKITGIAVKRSDTPKIIREFLFKLLEMFMRRIPHDEIRAAVREFKYQYHRASFLDIGRPMAIKVLHTYEQKFARTHDMKGFSYHIRASLYYNMLCGVNDVKIHSGDKIRVVYINHPTMKYIAVPVDAPVLPEFLDKLEINWKHQWEGVVAKINLYGIPAGFVYEDEV